MTSTRKPPERNGPTRGPLLLSTRPWAATIYLLSYPVVGTLLFVTTVASVLIAAALSIVWVGLPLLLASAVLARKCADVERWRAALVTDLVPAPGHTSHGGGFMARLRALWSDPATQRALGYLVLMYVPLLIMDTAVVALWLSVVGMVTVPLWFWAVPQNGGHGVMIGYRPEAPNTTSFAFGDGSFGLWIDDLPTALLAAALFLVLAFALAHLVTAVARLHGGVARSMLGPPTDPLDSARRVLEEPGALRRSSEPGEHDDAPAGRAVPRHDRTT
ncbi:Putative sensor [Actinopolyspora xinjiangensis]|uniref:Putative sensor n=1 Tax=Actinopolyspora xinjiangensis TaxID=405564 RepID=A0A1H0UDS2_9ACTN|nr:sensor domain-containing protein [Actinopolyspora xinjiangensis]SDP64324.1 Putative sensor [Actinopolyspora xinjiangensis]